MVLLVFGTSCKREFEPPTVENELLVPILKTSLDISRIVPDSLQSTSGDELVSLVYRTTLYEAALGSFEELDTKEFDKTAKLKELKLSPQTVTNSISLGKVATEEGGFTGQLIISQHGNNSAVPPVPGLSFGPVPIDGSAYFESLLLDSGYMDVTIHNGFPTGISNIQFEIVNDDANYSPVGSQSFAHIDAGATQTQTIDLAGDSIKAHLLANVLNFDIDGSATPVPIDTNDKITVTVHIRDMKVYSAKAIFPAQDVIDAADINAIDNAGDLRMVKAIAGKGKVNVRVVSTIEDTMYFDYYIPDGRSPEGVPFEIHERINPAPAGGSIEKIFAYDVSGYEFGLTGAPIADTVNVFYSRLVGRIDSTGRKVNITLDDSILVYVHLSDFIPEYIEGYLGDTLLSVGPETVPLDLFQKIEAKKLEFESVNMSLSVENGNGVPFEVAFQTMTAQNTNSGKTVNMDLGALPNPMAIGRATTTTLPWRNSWELNNGNSNVSEVFNILPNQFHTALTVETNPEQNTGDLGQFAVDSNTLAAYLDIEVPLSFMASDLLLSDTVLFDQSSIQAPENIGSGTFYLIAKNTLPLSAKLELTFITANGTELERIAFAEPVAAGSLDQPRETVLSWKFDRTSLNDILTSSRAIMSATVSTSSLTSPVKIYSSQNLDLQLTARFNYTYDQQ